MWDAGELLDEKYFAWAKRTYRPIHKTIRRMTDSVTALLIVFAYTFVQLIRNCRSIQAVLQ